MAGRKMEGGRRAEGISSKSERWKAGSEGGRRSREEQPS
jgi:hypothetical protein